MRYDVKAARVSTSPADVIATLSEQLRRLNRRHWHYSVTVDAAIACVGLGNIVAMYGGFWVTFLMVEIVALVSILAAMPHARSAYRYIDRERLSLMYALTVLVRVHDGRSPEFTAELDPVVVDRALHLRRIAQVVSLLDHRLSDVAQQTVVLVEADAQAVLWRHYGLCQRPDWYLRDEWLVTETGRAVAMAFRNSPLIAIHRFIL